MRNALKYEVQLCLTALMFYTRIPVSAKLPFSQNRLNRSRKYFPAIGIIVGSIAVLFYSICVSYTGSTLAVLISMCATVLATGAFHEDGFADSCDGLGGGWEKDTVLKIMKDSRIGTYGTIGLLFILAIKAASLVELTRITQFELFIFLYICAHTWSRQCASYAIDFFNYVQNIEQSKVKPITDHKLSAFDQCISLVTCVAVIIIVILINAHLIIAVLGCVIIAYLFLKYSEKRIGGYTGDILGATQQLTEVSFYVISLFVLSANSISSSPITNTILL